MNDLRLNIERSDAEEVKNLLTECYMSTKVTAKVLFPERFHLPFSPLHDAIFAALDDDRIQKVVIKAPRGMGKTSIVQLAYAAKKILFREKKYIVPISSTAPQALLQTENLKEELLKNEMIVKLFGSVKSDRFSKEQWVTSGGVMIMPRGSGQQVRGLLYRNSRPDLIIGDDLEDSEEVRSDDQRKKLKEWFYADVMNAVPKYSKDWKIVVIGTLLHEDSLLANLIASKEWYPIELELFDDNGKSNWPELMSDEDISRMVEEYEEAGELDVLYREYKGQAISTKDSAFMPSYFRYYNESDISPKKLESVVILDPAKTVKLHSAESGLVCWGIDSINNRLLVRDLLGKKLHPDDLYDELFAMCRRNRAYTIGVEVTSLHDWIMFPLKNEMTRRGLNYEIVELNAVGKKEDRAAWLVPLYRRGLVYHNKTVTGPLEAQLLSYPRNKRWDCIDAAAYIVKMLELGGRYFLPLMDSREGIPADVGALPSEDELEEPMEEMDEDNERENDLIVSKRLYRTI